MTQSQRQEALDALRAILKPGDTVYTVLRHRSASGMTRTIALCVIRDNEPRWFTYWLPFIGIGKRDDKHEGVKVEGCGMDMGFHVVYRLGQELWPDGTPEPHGIRNGEPDTSGGYALKHRWL